MTQTPEPWLYLRRARLRAGFGTATAAAEALGLSVTHYCSVEKGRRSLSDQALIDAAALYHVDVAELDASRPKVCRQPGSDRDVAA